MTYENSDFARQFRRILRQYRKCQASYTLGEQVGIFTQDREDAETVEELFSQFFIECYHLKDWIKNDKLVSPSIKSIVENCIAKSRPLSFAGDIANREKHLILNRPPKISKKVKLHSTPILLGPVGTYPIGGIYKFVIEVDTEADHERVDALALARDCVVEWKKFFKDNRLDY